MKKLFIFLMIALVGLFFVVPVSAETEMEMTMIWGDTNNKESLDHWALYQADSETGVLTPVLDTAGEPYIIPYTEDTPTTGNMNEYTTNKVFQLQGEPGQVITKWYAMTAINKDGDESVFSERAFVEFPAIPYDPMGPPNIITITVIVVKE